MGNKWSPELMQTMMSCQQHMVSAMTRQQWVNTLNPYQNKGYFADDCFQIHFLKKHFIFLFKFHWNGILMPQLTHWGQVTHICVGNLTIIGSDNGLSPGRRQAIIWTSAGILLIGPLGTNFSEILIGIQTFSFKKMHLKMASVKWRPFCPGLNVLTISIVYVNGLVPNRQSAQWWHKPFPHLCLLKTQCTNN